MDYGYKGEKETIVLLLGTMEEIDFQANKPTEFPTASNKSLKKEPSEPRGAGTHLALGKDSE